jgi:hypothetical protein
MKTERLKPKKIVHGLYCLYKSDYSASFEKEDRAQALADGWHETPAEALAVPTEHVTRSVPGGPDLSEFIDGDGAPGAGLGADPDLDDSCETIPGDQKAEPPKTGRRKKRGPYKKKTKQKKSL